MELLHRFRVESFVVSGVAGKEVWGSGEIQPFEEEEESVVVTGRLVDASVRIFFLSSSK